eukprot:2511865-Pyramimonas_sp.AAC.1
MKDPPLVRPSVAIPSSTCRLPHVLPHPPVISVRCSHSSSLAILSPLLPPSRCHHFSYSSSSSLVSSSFIRRTLSPHPHSSLAIITAIPYPHSSYSA